MNEGRTSLSRLAEGEYDLLVVSADGIVKSLKQDGFMIFPVGIGPEEITLVAIFGNHIAEVYYFRVTDNGGELLYTSTKFGNAPIQKTSAMRADCDFVFPR